jgi:hypothetical protein
MSAKHPPMLLILALVLLFSMAGPAWGQEGDDEPPIPVNEYGTPDMDNIDLTLQYTYESECVAACFETPLGDTGIYLTYDVYTDNYGNTWVVPDPVTILYTSIYPESLPPGLASRGDGWSYASLGVGLIEACGGLEAMGIDVHGFDCGIDPNADPIGFLKAYAEAHYMEGGHWEFMAQMWEALAAAGSLPLWQLAIIYPDDPFDPTDDATPTPAATSTPWPTSLPTPTPRPTATPMPTPIACPPESISQQPPVMILIESHPPNPVVVGQGGQGLDVSVRAISYPVIHRWWTPEREYECRWWDTDTYGAPWGHRGHCCPDDNPDCDRDHYYRVPEGDWYCQEHVQRIPDPILMEYLRGTADLHETSIAWIETDLAQKYPGARVRQPHWSVDGVGTPYFTADWRCIVEALVHFPFEDPGYYDVEVHGQTAGTIYTPPRSFSYVMEEPQAVYLMDTMLIR